MSSIYTLQSRIAAEAAKGDMSIDGAVYEQAGRDAGMPVLFAGSLDAPVAVLARDLGRDEVLLGEPLIGGAGQRVRRALYEFLQGAPPPAGDARLAETTSHLLLTNTVPYRPVGNKAYPPKVRERFRPFVAELLACHWTGDYIITMGTEAFQWFEPYIGKAETKAFWSREDRYSRTVQAALWAQCEGETVRKMVTIAPLPHPSPLNRTYLAQFPAMLRARLEEAPLAGLAAASNRPGPPEPPRTEVPG